MKYECQYRWVFLFYIPLCYMCSLFILLLFIVYLNKSSTKLPVIKLIHFTALVYSLLLCWRSDRGRSCAYISEGNKNHYLLPRQPTSSKVVYCRFTRDSFFFFLSESPSSPSGFQVRNIFNLVAATVKSKYLPSCYDLM